MIEERELEKPERVRPYAITFNVIMRMKIVRSPKQKQSVMYFYNGRIIKKNPPHCIISEFQTTLFKRFSL
jgi:hypothetical protein